MYFYILPFVLFSAFALALVRMRRNAIKQGKVLAHHFNGRFEQPFADAIIFHYRSRLFSLKRMASNGGLGGTCYYPALCAFLQTKTDLVIALASARPFLYVGDFPKGHRTVAVCGRRVGIVSKSADLLDRVVQLLSSDQESAKALSALLVKDYAYIRIRSETHITGSCLFKKRHRLMLVGLPDEVQQEPRQMEVVLDNLILLSGRLNLSLQSE